MGSLVVRLLRLTVEVLAYLAGLAASGQIELPIVATFPLSQVRQAFELVERRHTHRKVVLLALNIADYTTCRWSSDRAEDRCPVENPATGQVTTVVQGGGVPETDAAVRAAHCVFEQDWRSRSPAERADLLRRGADVLAAHADELARLESLGNGKPATAGGKVIADLTAVAPIGPIGGLTARHPSGSNVAHSSWIHRHSGAGRRHRHVYI